MGLNMSWKCKQIIVKEQILENQSCEQELNCSMQLKTDIGSELMETEEASRTRSELWTYTDLGMVCELN